ncbi:unnamed protein product [Chironomus riparius]|uniref:F-box domain-containing protein n=1 Tax=Chironomus riparius TaxID=315576 RepID=A0A9N9S6B5_9DIPT|nr:unnamed protein product [Chironomus riparius]
MNHLPEDVIIMIFEYLDNDSMLSVIQASTFFANIFSSSSKLLLKFNLFIYPENINQLLQNEPIANISFKNVTLFSFTVDSSTKLHELFKMFNFSIEILKLQNVTFNSFENFAQTFLPMLSLKSLHLEKCSIGGKIIRSLPPIQTLKSIIFDECRGNLFKYFKNQRSVEKIGICRHKWTSIAFSITDFNKMASNLPSLSHLVMDGTGTSGYFDCGQFPFKIQKLEAFLMTFNWTQTIPRLDFLKSQQGYLKELTIHKLPYDYDGGEMIKFIIEEMKLEKFNFGQIPLILNGRKQDVKELTAWEVNITAAFEIFRQFPSIQSFTLFLTQTHLNQSKINDIVKPRTDIFQNLKNLDILDHSGSYSHPTKFIGLYKNCKNITRLSLRTNNNVNDILTECLSYFTNLNEIYLTTGKDKSKESLKIIKNLAPNLKKLSVAKEVVNDAKNMFGKDVEIIEI